MGKKPKPYSIASEDIESVVYGSFHLADIKRMANALMDDISNHKSKNDERKSKKSLLKRLQKLIEKEE